jgi:hypothetical protein
VSLRACVSVRACVNARAPVCVFACARACAFLCVSNSIAMSHIKGESPTDADIDLSTQCYDC